MRNQGSERVRRADIWLVDFDPVVGHEQDGRRLGVVVSNDRLHAIPSCLVIVVPITTRGRGLRSHVQIDPPDGGLDHVSYAMTEQVRSLSTERLIRRLGQVGMPTLDAVMKRVGWFLKR